MSKLAGLLEQKLEEQRQISGAYNPQFTPSDLDVVDFISPPKPKPQPVKPPVPTKSKLATMLESKLAGDTPAVTQGKVENAEAQDKIATYQDVTGGMYDPGATDPDDFDLVTAAPTGPTKPGAVGELTGDVGAVYDAAKMLVMGTSPYAEDKDIGKEVLPRLKWSLTYYASLGGRLGPKGLRSELLQESEEFGGFGPATMPAAGDVGTMALEWGVLYPKLFTAAGMSTAAVSKIPKVAAATKYLAKMGGVEKVAAKYPRLWNDISKTMGAAVKGGMVGGTMGAAETVGKDMSAGEALGHIGKEAGIMAGVAAGFQAVSNVDTRIYVNKFRTSLVKASNARFAQEIQRLQGQPPSPETSARYKSLDTLKRQELRQIDGIVAEAEAQLRGIKSNKLYQLGQEQIESPETAAQRFIQQGFRGTGAYPAGPKNLQTGMATSKPVIDMPTTRAGEVMESIQDVGSELRHPIKAIRQGMISSGPLKVAPSGPPPISSMKIGPVAGHAGVPEEEGPPPISSMKIEPAEPPKTAEDRVNRIMEEFDYE